MGCAQSLAELAATTALAPREYAEVVATLRSVMRDANESDGSLAPVLIRLAWHASGTFDARSKTGGSNGATMRFAPERDDAANAGLERARAALAKVKEKHPFISYADLWILAGNVAIAATGGPRIPFRPGRTDATDPAKDFVPPPGRLPDAEHGIDPSGAADDKGRLLGHEKLAAHVRAVFNRMGFSDQEIVSLIAVGHNYGRCHAQYTGYAGPWVENPTRFSNEFAADLIEDEWTLVNDANRETVPCVVRPNKGKFQYVGKAYLDDPKAKGVAPQMMLPSDMVMLWDPAFRPHLEAYAKSATLLRNDFAKAWKKLTELGLPPLEGAEAVVPVPVPAAATKS